MRGTFYKNSLLRFQNTQYTTSVGKPCIFPMKCFSGGGVSPQSLQFFNIQNKAPCIPGIFLSLSLSNFFTSFPSHPRPLLQTAAPRFVWNGRQLLPSQLQLFHGHDVLSNRALATDHLSGCIELRAKPGTIVEEVTSLGTASSEPAVMPSLYVRSRSGQNVARTDSSLASAPLQRTQSTAEYSSFGKRPRRSSVTVGARPRRRSSSAVNTPRGYSESHDTPRLRRIGSGGRRTSPRAEGVEVTEVLRQESRSPQRTALGRHNTVRQRQRSPPPVDRKAKSMLFSRPARPAGVGRTATSSAHSPPRRTSSPPQQRYSSTYTAPSRAVRSFYSVSSSHPHSPQISARGQRQLDEIVFEATNNTPPPLSVHTPPKAKFVARSPVSPTFSGAGRSQRRTSVDSIGSPLLRTSLSAPSVQRRTLGNEGTGESRRMRDALTRDLVIREVETDTERDEFRQTVPQRKVRRSRTREPSQGTSRAPSREASLPYSPLSRFSEPEVLRPRKSMRKGSKENSSTHEVGGRRYAQQLAAANHLAIYPATRSKSARRFQSGWYPTPTQRRGSGTPSNDLSPPLRLPSFMKHNWKRRSSVATTDEIPEEVMKKRKTDEQRRKETANKKRREEAKRRQFREAEEEAARRRKLEEDCRKKIELESVRKHLLQKEIDRKKRARKVDRKRQTEPIPTLSESDMHPSSEMHTSSRISEASEPITKQPSIPEEEEEEEEPEKEITRPDSPTPLSPILPFSPTLRALEVLRLNEEDELIRRSLTEDEKAAFAEIVASQKHETSVKNLQKAEAKARGTAEDTVVSELYALQQEARCAEEGVWREAITAEEPKVFKEGIAVPFEKEMPEDSPYKGDENFLVCFFYLSRVI